MKPGKTNSITDISGILVGNAHHELAQTGVTVILAEQTAVTACSIPGGGPGTRETDALQPANLVERANAIVLAGGSVYGLDAAGAVAADLGRAGHGFDTGAALPSPIVPAAILYDLRNGGFIDDTRPDLYRALGSQALSNCATTFVQGNAGAGYGAVAGTIKGGLGSASVVCDDLPLIGAVIAANPFGATIDENNRLYAQDHALLHNGTLEYGDTREYGDASPRKTPNPKHPLHGTKAALAFAGANTTIGVIATDADLTKAEAQRVAIMAQDGLARAINPVHTPFDGDSLFVMATGMRPLAVDPSKRALNLTALGALAAQCVARAIGHAIWRAETLGAWPALNEKK